MLGMYQEADQTVQKGFNLLYSNSVHVAVTAPPSHLQNRLQFHLAHKVIEGASYSIERATDL